MTTGPTPPIIPSIETGTPSREWSESILASNTAKDTPATFSEAPRRADNPNMTQGKSREKPQVPKELEKQDAQQLSIGATVVQTAKQYVPEQEEKTVEHSAQTATAAGSYLPIPQGIKDTTVASHSSSEEHQEGPHVSLPSTELKGAQPSEHTGGVGALPGNLSESSVALLPDERQERAQECRPTSPRQRRDTIKPSAAGGDDEPRESEKEEDKAKIPRDAAPFKDEAAASQIPDDAPPKTRSGPEVKSQKEASEVKSREALSKQAKTAAVAGAGMAGTAAGAEGSNEKKNDIEGSNLASEVLGHGKVPLQDVQGEGNQEGRTATARKVEGGYSGEYHPAQLHPPPPGASAAEYQASVSVQQQGQGLPTTMEDKRASLGAEKKPGFMTVVKGEMKILAGKVSGDEHKVEEGKKLVHGEA
ncbi:hypothetical protein J3R83DRAFT_11518 [Lanmaoa asiatica]|nr:hypothetical protein J3R83DRAFT_11518 [Lanmaoa asiatica]